MISLFQELLIVVQLDCLPDFHRFQLFISPLKPHSGQLIREVLQEVMICSHLANLENWPIFWPFFPMTWL